MIHPKDRIIVALDTPSLEQAADLAALLKGRVGVFKIGLELVYSGGLGLARELADQGEKVFLDLKLLDIGHTVMKATRAVTRLGATFLTVHALDAKTMKAAVEGCGASDLKLLGVTVMTNLNKDDLSEQGIAQLTPAKLALQRARLAHDCGFDGVISSGHEAKAIRQAIGSKRLIITPGIRLPGGEAGDQSRVMTPAGALAAGADYLVIGRPITGASDPLKAIDHILSELSS